MTWWQILLIILAVILVLLVVLYFVGSKMQRKQAASQEQMDAMKQTLSMLIIDKKKMKLKDANLPDMVLQQTPKYMRRMKMPFVKAKVGPRIMTLIADPKVYEILPVKKEVKAVVSGIYITAVRGIRGPLEKPKKKKGFRARMAENYSKANEQLKAEEAAKKAADGEAVEAETEAEPAEKAPETPKPINETTPLWAKHPNE